MKICWSGYPLYDEPSHSKDHELEGHGVHNGIGDVPIKFFQKIFQVNGVEKKMWDGKEWILLNV